MPLNYDYECAECHAVEEHTILPAERNSYAPTCRACGGATRRLFPTGAQINVFESYHSEALGIDITGPQQKAEALKAMGLIESGDAVKGARNDDTENPHRVVGQAPKGVGLSDWQRAQERRQQIGDNFIAESVDKNGRVLNRQRAKDMKGPVRVSKAERERKEREITKMIGEQVS